MPFKTTLGAEFAGSELDEVREVAEAVRDRIAAIPIDGDPNVYWSLATMIVDQGFVLRGAIERITRAANDRAFGGPKRWDRGYTGPLTRPAERILDGLNLDAEEIDKLLEQVKLK